MDTKLLAKLVFVLSFGLSLKSISQPIKIYPADTVLSSAFEKIDSNILFFYKRHPNGVALGSKYSNDTLFGSHVIIRNHKKDTIKNITINLTLSMNENPNEIYEFIESFNPYLAVDKIFYENGNIHKKIIISWLGFASGKGYFFNRQGKLIKTKNFDKHYKFTFNNVLTFCTSNGISLKINERAGVNQRVQRLKYHGRKSWFITAVYPKINKWVTIVLDGKTGELKGILPAPVYPE